jgi:hypothetical protein
MMELYVPTSITYPPMNRTEYNGIFQVVTQTRVFGRPSFAISESRQSISRNTHAKRQGTSDQRNRLASG